MECPAFRAAEAETTRVVVFDEQAIFRSGLRRLLETQPGLRIVGETGDKSKLPAILGEADADVVVLSAPRNPTAALDLLKDLAAVGARARVVLLTASMETEFVNEALTTGARAVVPSDSAAEVLFESIACVMDGHYCIGRERGTDLASSVRRFDLARRHDKAFGLTTRELEILDAVVSGDTNKAIALRLEISENTVKRHLMHIFDKVGASNRVELAMFAAYHRLTGV